MAQPSPILHYQSPGPSATRFGTLSIVLLTLGLIAASFGLLMSGSAFLLRWIMPIERIVWNDFLFGWLVGNSLVVFGVFAARGAAWLGRIPIADTTVRILSFILTGLLLLPLLFVLAGGQIRISTLLFLPAPAMTLLAAIFSPPQSLYSSRMKPPTI